MKLFQQICAGLLLLPSTPIWAQVEDSSTQSTTTNLVQPVANSSNVQDTPMLTPPPVSGHSYPTLSTSGERSNYLRGGIAFTGAYSDNTLGSINNGTPVSDLSYSVGPFIELDISTSRLHSVLSYAPGFTFYQRTTSRNEADQDALIDLQYRMSPHVTLSARDQVLKSSNVFSQPNLAEAGAISGAAQQPNFSVIAPVADLFSNFGSVGISYQFGPNQMVGASGTFSNLHYLNPAQVPGLYDSVSQGGSAFYSLRISKLHYIGASYQYERLVSYPQVGQNETETHALFAFYTLHATSSLSFSLFGGPQHYELVQAPVPPLQIQAPIAAAWTPAAGASASWQGRLTNVALTYSHIISGGGGLVSAVKMDSASAAIQRQLTRRLSGSIAGGYSQNDILASTASSGHTVSGNVSLQQEVGQHINLHLGYMRLHQVYNNVAVLAVTPDTNREYISISYQFSRPLGR
jgi:hypothetical protein